MMNQQGKNQTYTQEKKTAEYCKKKEENSPLQNITESHRMYHDDVKAKPYKEKRLQKSLSNKKKENRLN